MTHLYEVGNEIKALTTLTENAGEDWETMYSGALEQLQGQFIDKAGSIAKFILNLEADAKAYKDEQMRLDKQRAIIENKVKYLKDYLRYNMVESNLPEVQCGILKIRVRDNPPSVNVIDEDIVPASFRRIIPETYEVNKRGILDHFKETGETPLGVEIIRSKKLEIK